MAASPAWRNRRASGSRPGGCTGFSIGMIAGIGRTTGSSGLT